MSCLCGAQLDCREFFVYFTILPQLNLEKPQLRNSNMTSRPQGLHSDGVVDTTKTSSWIILWLHIKVSRPHKIADVGDIRDLLTHDRAVVENLEIPKGAGTSPGSSGSGPPTSVAKHATWPSLVCCLLGQVARRFTPSLYGGGFLCDAGHLPFAISRGVFFERFSHVAPSQGGTCCPPERPLKRPG